MLQCTNVNGRLCQLTAICSWQSWLTANLVLPPASSRWSLPARPETTDGGFLVTAQTRGRRAAWKISYSYRPWRLYMGPHKQVACRGHIEATLPVVQRAQPLLSAGRDVDSDLINILCDTCQVDGFATSTRLLTEIDFAAGTARTESPGPGDQLEGSPMLIPQLRSLD